MGKTTVKTVQGKGLLVICKTLVLKEFFSNNKNKVMLTVTLPKREICSDHNTDFAQDCASQVKLQQCLPK